MNNWPSTTQVLKDAGLYGDSERWFRKADANQPADYACPTSSSRGTAIDGACNLILMGKELGVGSESGKDFRVHHAQCCMPFIEGYERFLKRHDVQLIECAFEVVDKIERTTGHPDQLIMLDGVRALIDIKTGGMPKTTALQTASYEVGMLSMGMPRVTRFGLQLARGDFKLHPFVDPFDKDKWRILARAWWIRAEYVGEAA